MTKLFTKRFATVLYGCWFNIIILVPVFAQIELNGSIDFEAAYGGKDSKFINNEIAAEFREAHLAINQFNLFLFAEIDENFFFNGRLQWDTWGTGKLNPPRLTLAALSWEPEELPLSITLGRFVSPFGLYPRRQLASENLFASAPLAYGYFINMSDTHGYLASANEDGSYNDNSAGLTTVYFGGYTTGIMTNLVIAQDFFDVSLAVTNTAPASQRNFSNTNNTTFLTRLGFQPWIYWQQGFSFSYGGYKQVDTVNEKFDNLKFTQSLLGLDFIIAAGYFELSGEYMYATWKSVASDSVGIDVKADGTLLNYKMKNSSGYVDLKYEPPFLTGSYIALRYEHIRFGNLPHPEGSQLITPHWSNWDDNLTRYSAAIGYKISRNILLKIAFSEQRFDERKDQLEDYTARSILTISM